MNKNQTRIITFLSLTVFLLVLLLSVRLYFRLDLTRNKAYTISEVSKKLYTEISDQVRITYFFPTSCVRPTLCLGRLPT